MFRECINNPIDPIPQEYVNSICRLANEPDYSLTCLGIALLKPRIEDYRGIDGQYTTYRSEDACIDNFINYCNTANDKPIFCYYRYENEGNPETIKKILSEHGFEYKENIAALIQNKANVKCIAAYHKTKNCAGIFIQSNDFRLYHLIISFLSLLYPALFANKPLQPDEYELIKTLGKTDKNSFIKRIQISVQPYVMDFRRMMLGNLLRQMHETKIQAAFNNVTSARRNVETRKTELATSIERMKELIVIYEGMKATEMMDKPEEELIEYISTNKQIHNITMNGTRMTFTVASLLNNYNPDAWATFSSRGYIYDGPYWLTDMRVELLDAFKSKDNRKLLLDNLFSETPEFSIKIVGNYTLDFNNCAVVTQKALNYEAMDPMYKDYLPNPHLKLYACLGNYSRRIMNALQERNYISAIEMCCASAGSVDLDECEQTFRPFLGWIMSSKAKILHRKDGVDMTPEEALVYLTDKGAKE